MVSNARSLVRLVTHQLARLVSLVGRFIASIRWLSPAKYNITSCGADPDNGKPDAVPSNCTVGPVQPFYWYQNERNNVRFDRLFMGLLITHRWPNI